MIRAGCFQHPVNRFVFSATSFLLLSGERTTFHHFVLINLRNNSTVLPRLNRVNGRGAAESPLFRRFRRTMTV